MARKSKEDRIRDNLMEVGIDDEAYWRYWYDLYHRNMVACNPQNAAVLTKYANMPAKWREKFLMEALNINKNKTI